MPKASSGQEDLLHSHPPHPEYSGGVDFTPVRGVPALHPNAQDVEFVRIEGATHSQVVLTDRLRSQKV